MESISQFDDFSAGESICPTEKCTGCGLCVAQCPRHCISMKEGLLGHLYPSIDYDRCVNCGRCVKGCPSNSPIQSSYPLTAYAAWSKDEMDYKTSSSGGVASVLSTYVINMGGVVYGCAFQPDMNVRHIRVDKLNDAERLKGSKYVQSSIVEIMPLLKNDVDFGKKVLFVGTPCQTAAVKRLYEKQPDNLYLVDLICHGTPSLKFLRTHLNRVAYNAKYDEVSFRGESGYIFSVKSAGREVYRKKRNRDFYLGCFLMRYTLRESCYSCLYACPERVSDITIGDFWGLGKLKPAGGVSEHRYGCSVVLPITTKGISLIRNVSLSLNIYEREIQEAITGNDSLRYARGKTLKIRIFRNLSSNSFFILPALYCLFEVERIMLCFWRRCIKHLMR